MKKILWLLFFLPAICFGSGIYNPGSGGASSLPLPPGDTNYIQVRNDSLQNGATFYVSSGTVSGPLTVSDGGAGSSLLNLYGPFTIDRPDIPSSGFAQRSSLFFDPHNFGANLIFKSLSTSFGSDSVIFNDSSANNFLSYSGTPGNPPVFQLSMSSWTASGLNTRWNISDSSGTHNFLNSLGQAIVDLSPNSGLVLYDSGHSKFTSLASTAALSYSQRYVLPDSTGTVNQSLSIKSLNSDGSVSTYWQTSAGGTPSGPNLSIQFNDSGSFGGSTTTFYSKSFSGINYQSAAGDTNASILRANTDATYPFIIDDIAGNHQIFLSGGGANGGTINGIAGINFGGSFPKINLYGVEADVFGDRAEAKSYLDTTSSGIGFRLINRLSTTISLVLQGASGQTGNFFACRDFSSSDVFVINSSGSLQVGQKSITSSYSLVVSSSSTGLFFMTISTVGIVSFPSNNGSSVTSCGTSPSVIGNNVGGTITVGSGISVTACTLNFPTPFKNTPLGCTANDDNSAIATSITSISATSVTFSLTASLAGGHIYYHCDGND